MVGPSSAGDAADGVDTGGGIGADWPGWLVELSLPPSEATIRLTPEELAVLARVAGLPLVPLLRYDPIDALATSERASAEEATRGALVEREIIEADGRIAEPVRALLDLLAGPQLVGRVEVTRVGVTLEWHYACTPDGAVEAVETEDHAWRFSAFPVGGLIDRMLALTGLGDRPAAGSVGASVPMTTVRAIMASTARAATADDAVHALVGLLQRSGGPTESVPALARVLSAETVLASVTLLYQPGEHVLAGGKLDWLDGGGAGLWLVDLPDEVGALGEPVGLAQHDVSATERAASESDPSIEFRPVTAGWIRTELGSYLPSAEAWFDSAP